MAYPLPPWLVAANPAAEYLNGIRTGASIGEAQSRLQEAQVQARMEEQARQEQLAASALQAKTRLDYENAYRQQSIALDERKLKDVEAVNRAKTEEAARKWKAQNDFAAAYQSSMASGSKDPMLDAMMKVPDAFNPNLLAEHQKIIQPKVHFGPNGQVLQEQGGEISVLREPDAKPPRYHGAHVSIPASGSMPEMSGPMDHPDIIKRLKEKADEDAREEAASAQALKDESGVKKIIRSIFGGAAPKPAVLPPASVAPSPAQEQATAPAAPAPAAAEEKGTREAPYRPTSRQEYDELESGDYYIDPNGKLRQRK